jgi:hypothetical protein
MRTRAILASMAALAAGVAVATPALATGTKIVHYPNCKALNRVYPHGVGQRGARDKVRGHTAPVTTFSVNNALYAANRGRDGDHDGIACEKR